MAVKDAAIPWRSVSVEVVVKACSKFPAVGTLAAKDFRASLKA